MNHFPNLSPEHARMIRKLESIAHLGADDKRALAGLPLRIRNIEDHTDLVQEGDRPTDCCLIVDGFFCRYSVLGGGQRQIMAFHMAGDLVDLQTLHLKTMDHSICALTPGRVAFIRHSAMHEVMTGRPAIVTAFWRETLIVASVFQEWLASTGRRAARERIAHLLCEVFVRMRAVGLADPDGFQFPVTQTEIGDSLGLSSVHVNRVLQDLRRDGLIASRGRFVAILDWERLCEAGDFDDLYLHMVRDAA